MHSHTPISAVTNTLHISRLTISLVQYLQGIQNIENFKELKSQSKKDLEGISMSSPYVRFGFIERSLLITCKIVFRKDTDPI